MRMPTSFIPSKSFLLFEGKIQTLETECRQALILFLACCCFTVFLMPLEDWKWGALCGRQQLFRESYSYSFFPAGSHQSPRLFSKGSKLHTKLRQHGRIDLFAGKDMVVERRGQAIFVCVCGNEKDWGGEDRRTTDCLQLLHLSLQLSIK